MLFLLHIVTHGESSGCVSFREERWVVSSPFFYIGICSSTLNNCERCIPRTLVFLSKLCAGGKVNCEVEYSPQVEGTYSAHLYTYARKNVWVFASICTCAHIYASCMETNDTAVSCIQVPNYQNQPTLKVFF